MIGKEFIDSLKGILFKEHCVVIPNFGAFVLRDNGSTMNIYTKELKPNHSNVYFNKDIRNDDGLLTNFIKDKMNLSYKDSASYIQDCISQIFSSVDERKVCNLTPLGNFFKNAEGELFFIGNTNLNMNVHSFGLKTIKWNVTTNVEKAKVTPLMETIEQNKIVEEAVVIEVSTEEQDYSENKHHKNKFWSIAANVALITLSAGVLYMNTIFLKSALTSSEKSMASSIPAVQNNTEKQEIERSSVMVINGKIVQLDEQNNVVTNDKKDHSDIPNIEDYKSMIAAGKGKFFVVGGSYITEDAAKIECKQWNQLKQNATFIKVKGSTLLKVVIKRFESGKDASAFVQTLTKLPNNTISVQELTISK